MTTRRHTLTLSAALAAAACLAALLAIGSTARGASGNALALNVTATKISGVDVPPMITNKRSPETPGDEVIAVSKLSGPATGHRYLVCTVTQTAPSIAKALYACQVTYELADGTITASGVFRLNGKATAAITGGTGAYAGAGGVVRSVPGLDTLTLA